MAKPSFIGIIMTFCFDLTLFLLLSKCGMSPFVNSYYSVCNTQINKDTNY